MNAYGHKTRNRWFCRTFFLLVVFLLLACPSVVLAKVQTEDVPVLTRNLVLNGSIANQKITDTNKEHWYTITNTETGKLTLTLNGNVKTLGLLRLYDVNGSVELKNVHVESTTPGVIEYDLYPGTYFVKVERSNNDWVYSLSNTFTAVKLDGDQEPNDIYGLAQTLDLNSTVTGNLGYYSDSYTDGADWWQVTTTKDGLLKVDVTVTEAAKGTLMLYDINCSVELARASFDYKNDVTTASVEYNLMPATYYIKMERTAGAGEYTLTNTFTGAVYDNDPESNDTYLHAQPLSLNSSTTGHLGHHYYGTVDDQDWWKITTNQDGLLKVNIEGTEATKGYLKLYDNYQNGLKSIELGSNNQPVDGSIEYELKAGTYYAKVERSLNSVWSYEISNSFTPMAVEGEHPGKDAKTLPLNGSVGGSISNEKKVDWWKVTTDADGLLTVNFEANVNPGCYVYVYDQNGVNWLGYIRVNEEKTGSLSYDNLKPGTYYVKVEQYYNYAFSYTLSSSFTKAPLANDPEPNDIIAAAQVLPLNGSVTGHIGYYRDVNKDTVDWWKVTTDADGLLTVNFEANKNPGCYVYVYDQNGANRLGYTRVNEEKTGSLSYDNLKPGTYYVKVEQYYNLVFSYTLSSSFTKAPLDNDSEPNDIIAAAQVLPLNGSVTGHIGYYRDANKDTVDWWKVTTDADGLLTVNFEASKNPGCYVYLYDQNGANRLGYIRVNEEKTGSLSYNLKPGTYYVKVEQYYNFVFSYTLSSSLTKAPLANDPEPNFHHTKAGVMTLDKPVTGHFGYSTNYFADTADWWKVNLTQTGTLTVNMMPTDKAGCQILIYGSDETTWLSYVNTYDAYSCPTSFDAKISEPGDYYILIQPYYSGRVFSYYLTASLTTGTQSGPAVKSVYPTDNSTVARNFEYLGVPVLATFNKKMKADSFIEDEFGDDGITVIKPGTFRLLDSAGLPVGAEVTCHGTMASLVPYYPLKNGVYTAILTGDLLDETSTALGSEYRWTFTVADYDEGTAIIPITEITLDRTTLQMTEKTSETLTATVYPANASNKNISWHSSNTVAAKVNQYGLVTAVAPGEALITVIALDGGKSATCTVNVTAATGDIVPVTAVTLNKTHLQLTENTSETLIATVSPSNANNKNVQWVSSNNAIATVDQNGRVTAMVPGETTITVTTLDGNKTTTCNVIVTAATGGIEDYVVWPFKETGPNKVWTITFSEPVDQSSIDAAIYVNDSYDLKVATEFVLINGNKSVQITPPDGGYEAGSYTLFINNKLRSANGKALKQLVKMPFTVKSTQSPGIF